MDFFKSKHRLGLYLLLLAVLALGALAAVWSVSGTGAYLTQESDWQSLAGDYRIGTIDYTVRINDDLLLGRSSGGDDTIKYELAVPILGGVRMFDPDPALTPIVLDREFNEGATLMRVRVTNYSKNMVDVSALFTFLDQTTGGAPPIRVLALPVSLNEHTAATFDYRQYILNTLQPEAGTDEADSLSKLATAYAAYVASHPMQLEMGLLPGSISAKPAGVDNVLHDGDTWCYYKDVFLLVWSEYGSGEYNLTGADSVTRQGRFQATFTVGQLD